MSVQLNLEDDKSSCSCQPQRDRGAKVEATRQQAPGRIRKLAIRIFATINSAVPKIGRKVLVQSNPDLEDGIQSVLHELLDRGFKPVVLFSAPDTPKRFAEAFGCGVAVLVPRNSVRAAVHFLTARYIFVTHGLFGHPKPPARQCVVNIWHGEPAGKVLGRYEGEATRHASVSPVQSTLGQAYRCTEFGLHPSQVPVLGAPRNDRLLRADRAAVRRRVVPDRFDGPAYLWMPTFRATAKGRHGRTDVTRRFPLLPFSPAEVRRLDEWLTRHGALIVVKAHPLNVDEMATGLKAIRVLTQRDLERLGLTVYTALPAFDGLISDISSVWVDYLLLNRPIIYAFPDIDDYREGRGINLEPYENWVPGPLARSIDDLTRALGDAIGGRDEFSRARKDALSRLHKFQDDKSAERLVNHVMAVQSDVNAVSLRERSTDTLNRTIEYQRTLMTK